MPSTSVTRPPIPQAPLVDPRTGMVTREWWRWFAAVGTASVATTASITNITNDITNIIEEAQPIPLLDDPSDPAASDQLLLMAAMLAPRDGLPGYVQGSILAGAAGGWFATRTISKSPTGYPGAGAALAGKYTAFDTTGNTLEIANDDQHAPRI